MEINRRYPLGAEFTSTELAGVEKARLKKTSNSLRRLHQMGFLRRRRVKRYCYTPNLEQISKKPVRKLFRVRVQDGSVRLVRRKIHLRFCRRGYQYRYSLSRQGSSYVKWLRNVKPIEDMAYLSLNERVMEALPGSVRHDLGMLGALRATYRYRGPSRHLTFIENPASLLTYAFAQNLELKHQIGRLKIELLKATLRESRSEARANEAEGVASLCLFLVCLSTLLFVQRIAELQETIRAQRADHENFVSITKLVNEEMAKIYAAKFGQGPFKGQVEADNQRAT